MKKMFDEYVDIIFQAIISIIVILLFVYVALTNLLGIGLEMVDNALTPLYIEKKIEPVKVDSFIAKDILIKLNDEIDYQDRFEAFNSNGESIKEYVSVMGLDNKEVGEKEITYILNYNGERQAIKAKLIVVDEKEEINT